DRGDQRACGRRSASDLRPHEKKTGRSVTGPSGIDSSAAHAVTRAAAHGRPSFGAGRASWRQPPPPDPSAGTARLGRDSAPVAALTLLAGTAFLRPMLVYS